VAATDLERLIVQLEAQSTKLDKSLAGIVGNVDKQLNRVEKRTDQMSQRVTAGFGKAGVAIASFFSARAIVGFISRISEAADKLQELSNRTGVGTEELQRLAGAAAKANVDTASLNDALDVFARNLGRAAEGQGDLAKVMKELGLSAAGGLVPTLLDVADAVQKAETRTEEYRITTAAFGRSSVELVGFLRQGRDAIREQTEAFNNVISAEANKALADFNQHWEEIQVSLTNIGAGPAAFALAGLSDFIHTLEQGTWPQRLQALASFFSGGIVSQPLVGLEDQITKVGNALDVATDKVMRMNSAIQDAPNFFTAEEIGAAADEMVRLQKELTALVKQRPPSTALPTVDKPFGGEAGDPAEATKRAVAEARLQVETLAKISTVVRDIFKVNAEFVSNQFVEGRELAVRSGADIARIQEDELERARRLSDELIQLARDTADETIRARANAAEAQADLGLARAEGTPGQFEAERAIRQQLIDDNEAAEIEAAESRLARQIEELERSQESLDKEGEAWREFQDLRVQLEQAAQDKISAIRDEAAARRIEQAKAEDELRLTHVAEFFGNLASLSQSGNETLAAIGKAAAIAEATINGIRATLSAFADTPGPIWVKTAAATAAGVFAAVQVAKISAMEKGGIVGPGGEMPLRRYARGGVASSPQMALFGEGSMNEAFVPLPDGRRIPVSLKMPQLPAGSSSSNSLSNVFHIDARGADEGVAERFERTLDAWHSRVLRDVGRRLPDMMNRADFRKR